MCGLNAEGTAKSIKGATAQQSQYQPGESCDDYAADLAHLVDMLSRAKVVPATKRRDFRRDFARKLLDQGVSNERDVWDWVSADPPDFHLMKDIVMTAVQKRSLDAYLKNL